MDGGPCIYMYVLVHVVLSARKVMVEAPLDLYESNFARIFECVQIILGKQFRGYVVEVRSDNVNNDTSAKTYVLECKILYANMSSPG